MASEQIDIFANEEPIQPKPVPDTAAKMLEFSSALTARASLAQEIPKAEQSSLQEERALQVVQKKLSGRLLTAADEELLGSHYAKVREARSDERALVQLKTIADHQVKAIHPLPPAPRWPTTRGAKSFNSEYVRSQRMKINFDQPESAIELNRLVKELAAWREISQRAALRIIEAYPTASEAHLQATGDVLSRDAYIVGEFQKGGPKTWSKRSRAYVDLETTGLDPYLGDIIEVGILLVKPDGTQEVFDQVFDLESTKFREVVGTGAVEIHKIEPTEVAGKPSFSSPKIQEALAAILCNPNVVQVAHNDNFEHAWFKEHLDGYWELRDRELGETPGVEQDTMWLSKFLLHDTANNKLQSMVEESGLAYENAHRALPDALMTHKALLILGEALASAPYGVRPTKEDRLAAGRRLGLVS